MAHRILVTGASGQLGGLVVAALLETTPAAEVAVTVRNPDAAGGLAALGVQVHAADYTQPNTLDKAFAGVDRLLLISSSEIGRRIPQHRNVIEAAKRAGVALLAYTSLLHADVSPLALAAEHRDTEALLRASGIPFVVLRNGWYNENDAAAAPAAVSHRAVMGSAGEGRISAASRADYAAAAAAVLTAPEDVAGRTYELAGDDAYTKSELAAEIARQSGQAMTYVDLPEAGYKAALIGAGLPEELAALLSDSDVGASKGGLFDESRQLSKLIGRATTPMAATIALALAGSAQSRAA